MKCIHVDHIAINAINLQISEHFYGNLLALERLESIDMEDHMLTYYRIDDTCRLELITYQKPLPQVHYKAEQPGVYRHFSLEVDDVQAYYCHLQRSQVSILLPPKYVEKLKAICMLIQDPNGIEIELMQYLHQTSKTYCIGAEL